MPKIVDHEERRRQLAAAVWRVISRDGVEGVSIRDVAAEANWSSGALRHYFRTKDDLLGFAAGMVYERVYERLAHRTHRGTLTEAVRATLVELLPLDADRRTEASIWLAFTTRSLVDARIAAEQRVTYTGLHELCSRITNQAAEYGRLKDGIDPEREATRLHALLDGLTLHLLMGQLTADAARAALDAHLKEIIIERDERPGNPGGIPDILRPRKS